MTLAALVPGDWIALAAVVISLGTVAVTWIRNSGKREAVEAASAKEQVDIVVRLDAMEAASDRRHRESMGAFAKLGTHFHGRIVRLETHAGFDPGSDPPSPPTNGNGH